MSKLKVGIYWGASCGGCEISVLEIHENLLALLEVAEIVFCPCLIDFKYKDVEAMPDESIDLCLVNGAVRTEENEEIAKLLRKKSKVLAAYGACASMGGIPGLANMYDREDILDRVYRTTELTFNPDGKIPETTARFGGGGEVTLPRVLPSVKALHHVVPVDYTVPGCPPVADQVWAVLQAVASGALPPRGSVVGAGDKAVCDECVFERRHEKVGEFKRPHEFVPDGERCLLEQGLLCMGPATRSGCGAQCLSASMPCRGCYGPAEGVNDQGAKMISVIGSIIDSEDEAVIAGVADQIDDPTGFAYRFGMAASALGRKKTACSCSDSKKHTPKG